MLRAAHTWLPLVGRPARPKKTLAHFYLHLLEWLDHRERSQSLDARMARDAGLPCGSNERFNGFRLDPRPFWGIGHTPLPINIATHVKHPNRKGPVAIRTSRRWWFGHSRT